MTSADRSANGCATRAGPRRASRARARGIAGGPTCASGRGARSARTTAPTATPGATSRTTMRGRGRTAGARTAWPASRTSSAGCAWAWRCGTAEDPILKERMFGLTNGEGNHGEDVKEYWWYLDAVPSGAWMRWRYHYPQAALPVRGPHRRERPARQGARARVRAARHRASSTTTATGSSRSTTPRPSPTDLLDARRRPQRRARDGHAPRPADALVPQHLVVGPGDAAASPGRRSGGAGTIQADAPRARSATRSMSAPAPDGSRAGAAVLRERDEHGPPVRRDRRDGRTPRTASTTTSSTGPRP